jgi:hypothetical protein
MLILGPKVPQSFVLPALIFNPEDLKMEAVCFSRMLVDFCMVLNPEDSTILLYVFIFV